MLLALESLRIGQLAAGGEHAVLHLQCGCIRSDVVGHLGRGGIGGDAGAAHVLCRFCNLQPGDKAFEISLLLGLEIARLRSGRYGLGAAHSAGTCDGAPSVAAADTRGLCVM